MALLMDRPSGLRWGVDGVAGPSCVCPDIAASGQARPARPLAGLDTPLDTFLFPALWLDKDPGSGSWLCSII